MPKFRVRVEAGTGHDDLEEVGPEFFEFNTEAERMAFLKGVDVTREAMSGWVDAWVDAREA